MASVTVPGLGLRTATRLGLVAVPDAGSMPSLAKHIGLYSVVAVTSQRCRLQGNFGSAAVISGDQ